MGFIYSSLNRGAGESVALFDNRIARMLPFVTGKAYFDLRNYDAQTGEFGVYIEWDGELDAVLGYSLPAGGYFVKATTPQAYRFHRLDKGLPVYMKLIAQNGRLYPYRTYVMMDGRPFSVEFGGGVMIPFEDRYEELGCEAAKQTVDTGSQKLLMGSQSGMTGSQRFRWNGSQMRLLFGSQGGFRYLAGSQYRMIGSQRFRWNGSQMRQLFGSQGGFRYLAGSQYRVFGSQRIKNMPMVLESDTQWPQDSMDSIRTSQELMVEFPKEWQLINRSRRPASRIGGNAKFGYGLDLI
ncbi:hypothetical protein DWW60_03405 [Coprococcus sp. AF16-22]|uniref:hypothetical protein n=1 Tax=Coprococcus sp. AF16-22 TaxID=2293087 RepID=UPI000E4840C0|nr:hypothetical protein [Coprococcus sp. AF16-22]RGG99788.1 hypothetical protein DWW60_03405 [Coprococcus sp. AF16-22]